MNSETTYDVAIVGGGPAGSTTGTLLKKYDPSLRVLILERERFPRDHVGESQLPGISRILDEMGVWDAVERAGFPIKVGATYLWGRSKELWDFDFMPTRFVTDEPRPARYEGQRRHLAFQVDRAVYDDILLRHAEILGCEVREETPVRRVLAHDDRIDGLVLESGEVVRAAEYLDCSGGAGILRRALNVATNSPTALQNVAMWDYWRNADWAEEIGVGGTRVQVMSVGYGWVWFIPLGTDRTSVGLVVPKAYLKACGLPPRALYAKALDEQARVRGLMRNATNEGRFATTRDWSFVAQQMTGANWMLVGESAGFADPILAAGMTITHAAAREAAYTILESRRGGDGSWLKAHYAERQAKHLRTHIRFADYWYTANAQFTDLQAHTADIARENGLDLSPERAWAWLAQGGFIDSEDGVSVATFSPEAMVALGRRLSDLPAERVIEGNNVFRLHLEGAAWRERPTYDKGRVHRIQTLEREGKVWPMNFPFDLIHEALGESERLVDLLARFRAAIAAAPPGERGGLGFRIMLSFETLVRDGWIVASYDPDQPLMKPYEVVEMVHDHREAVPA